MMIPICFNPREKPWSSGEFSDVWKGEHQGKKVAAKVLRGYEGDGPEEIKKVGRP